MKPIPTSTLLEFVVRFANYKAYQLSGSYGFSRDEQEDLAQDLLLDYFRRRSKYDPHRSPARAFAVKILQRRVATLVAFQMAQVRDYRRRAASANEGTPNCLRFDARAMTLDLRLRDLQIDVRRIVRRLPPLLSEVARLLEFRTPTESAALLGFSRSKLYKLIAELRKTLMDAGLDGYLGESESSENRGNRRRPLI